MPVFACRGCNCVENSACCNYWSAKMEGTPILCSACDPSIKAWHQQFKRRSAVGMMVDSDGHLWSSATGLPPHLKLLGIVLAMKGGFEGNDDE